MKLRREDTVMVISGRDKGKTGKVIAVMPTTHAVVVEGVNVAKRHTKPSQKQPRGGILELTRPIDVSKVMVIDPGSGKPARIGYAIKADGSKERVFKVSAAQSSHDKPKAKPAAPKTTKKAASTEDKAGKK